jgi:hypothetical protein
VHAIEKHIKPNNGENTRVEMKNHLIVYVAFIEYLYNSQTSYASVKSGLGKQKLAMQEVLLPIES